MPSSDAVSKDLRAGSDSVARYRGRRDPAALGRFLKQNVIGRVEKTHRAGLLVNSHLDARRRQSECLIVFLLRQTHRCRLGDDREAFQFRQFGARRRR